MLPSESLAARAISLMVAPAKPLREKTCAAASRICVRRAPSLFALTPAATRGITPLSERSLSDIVRCFHASCQDGTASGQDPIARRARPAVDGSPAVSYLRGLGLVFAWLSS